MKIQLLRAKRNIWLAIFTLIGILTGCESAVKKETNNTDEGEKYGVRMARYSLDLAVIDNSRQPLEGVLVEVIDSTNDLHDSLYSDSDGLIGFSEDNNQITDRKIHLKISDPNNVYLKKDTFVIFSEPEFKGGSDDGWDWGEAIKVLTIKMEKK